MESGLTTDPIFIGATRPPMKFGVTYTALWLNVLLTLEVFIITNNMLWLSMWLPVYATCYIACKHDPRFFDLALLWLKTRGPGWLGNLRYYKANAYSPLVTNMPDINGKRRAR